MAVRRSGKLKCCHPRTSVAVALATLVHSALAEDVLSLSIEQILDVKVVSASNTFPTPAHRCTAAMRCSVSSISSRAHPQICRRRMRVGRCRSCAIREFRGASRSNSIALRQACCSSSVSRYRDASVTSSASLRLDSQSGRDSACSPHVGAIFRPADSTAIKLQHGVAFRNPNAYELYYNVPQIGYRTNPSLRAVRVTSRELTLEREFVLGASREFWLGARVHF